MRKSRFTTLEPKWLLVGIFFLAGGFMGGLSAYLIVSVSQPKTIKYHLGVGTHHYTNPTLVSEPVASGDFSSVNNDLQLKIRGIIAQAQASKDIGSSGIYFRDLEPGTWLAINADMTFSPGYLLKIPIMITYYKLAEQKPSTLNENILDDVSTPQKDLFYLGDTMHISQTYTISNLMERMIVGSDDTATTLLFRNVDKSILNEIFSDLGIDFIENEDSLDTISLRRYSLFFRTLYNATYLSTDYSEKALALLAQNAPHSLLQSDIPESVEFASRVGGRQLAQKGPNAVEAYECDVVYYPNHDYILCAVARGKSSDAIAHFFTLIGTAVYNNAQYQYPRS